jgi:hypothetical protein
VETAPFKLTVCQNAAQMITGKEPRETAVIFHELPGEDFDDDSVYRSKPRHGQHKFSRNIPNAHFPEQPVALCDFLPSAHCQH